MEFTNPLPFRHQREPKLPTPLHIPPAAPPTPAREDLHAAAHQAMDESQPHFSYLPSPSPRPRSPLPPHKLASIANALGVNTPMPAFYRAPSPSGSSSSGRTPSRYLLHVVPPQFLPSDDDDNGHDPDATHNASSPENRSQFRRGTLIPLYPSLQSQLGAIAREYNLPSTGGLVLYLMHSSYGAAPDGPRISDDVWKLLWHKALQAERKDSQIQSPSLLDLRSGRSTPSSPLSNSLRDREPQTTTSAIKAPSPLPYPSPASDSPLSLPGQYTISSPDLPSDLIPNPYLPILAKVEFDIDRRKAGWFESWARGRRSRSRWRTGVDGGTKPLKLPERAQSRGRFHADISPSSEDSNGYAPLDDDGEDEQDQTVTIPRSAQRRQDPLADVFGSDAATWGDMQTERPSKSKPGLNPELIIPPGVEARREAETGPGPQDSDEVVKLWDENHRPTLRLEPTDMRRKAAPAPLVITSPNNSPSSSIPYTPKSALPYLTNFSPQTGSSSSEIQEKKARRRTGMIIGDLKVKVVAEPEEMTDADRSSQILMKQKLDQLEKQLAVLSPRKIDALPPPLPQHSRDFDPDSDRPLRSAPPGVNTFNITPPRHKATSSINTPSPRKHDSPKASTDPFLVPPRKDSLAVSKNMSKPPRPTAHKRAPSSQSSSGSSSKTLPEVPSGVSARPSLPKSQPSLPTSSPPRTGNNRLHDRSPPQLTLKRASDARKGEVSEETHGRSTRIDGGGPDMVITGTSRSITPSSPALPISPDPFSKQPLEDLRPSSRRSNESARSTSNVTESRSSSRAQTVHHPASVPEDEEMADTQSSRFSLDSDLGGAQQQQQQLVKQHRRGRSGSIVSVRSLRNLWRKSGASSLKGAPSGERLPPPLPNGGGEMSPSFPPPDGGSIAAELANNNHRGGGTTTTTTTRTTTAAADRARKPSSAATRPDSGSDPFQFDNSNIYQSSSTTSLASAASNHSSSASAAAAGVGSIGYAQSRGILKGWNGSAHSNNNTSSSSDGVDAPRMRRPSAATLRSISSMNTDGGGDSPQSPLSHRQHATPSSPNAPPEPVMMMAAGPRSLPTNLMLGGFSRYPESLSTDDGGSIRHFEMASSPTARRTAAGFVPLTPLASYHGEISH